MATKLKSLKAAGKKGLKSAAASKVGIALSAMQRPGVAEAMLEQLPAEGERFVAKNLIQHYVSSEINKNEAVEALCRTAMPIVEFVSRVVQARKSLIDEAFGWRLRKTIRDVSSQFNNPNFRKQGAQKPGAQAKPQTRPPGPGEGVPVHTPPRKDHPRRDRQAPLKGQPLAHNEKLQQMKAELEGQQTPTEPPATE